MILLKDETRNGNARGRHAYAIAARASAALYSRYGRKSFEACDNPATADTFSRPKITPPMAVRDAGRRYGTPKRPSGPEAILHLAWRNAGLKRAEMRGRDGHTYRIVYGGRPGGSFGPDFADAVVERDDGTVFRGDIEIHVRESDWRAHGHHKDPRYNGVVLHVVAAESEGRPAVKATGASIPLLALNWKSPVTPGPTQLNRSDPQTPEPPGAEVEATRSPPSGPLGTLDLAAAGLARFHSQAAGIALDIESFGVDQAVWLGTMGALGYPRNKRAFRTLATHVPWSVAAICESSLELESLLMWAAGFGARSAMPRATVADTSGLVGRSPNWVRPWGRPANSPVARIKAISALVPKWASQNGIANTCAQWVASVDRPTGLSAMFRPAELAGDVTVLGSARAAEIVVNVLLPVVFAMTTGTGARAKGVSLKNRVLALFDAHPRLMENSLTKEAKIALGVDYLVPKISSARDQQGLVALYREMFRRGVTPRQTRLPGI